MGAVSEDPPIRCFLSYAQADDLETRFVRPFKNSLASLAYLDRGRRLEIFHDRDSLAWGALAQPTIRESVRSALVLLPIITRQYFDRPYCREELLTFHNQAAVDGVPSLLLPVVLLGESYLTEDNPDPAVRIIVERQQRKLREAWIEGVDSPVWRRTLLGLANELVDGVEQAERTLAVPAEPERPDPAALVAAVENFAHLTTQVAGTLRTMLDDSLVLSSDQVYSVGVAYQREAVELDRLLRADPGAAYRFVQDIGDLSEFVGALERLVAGTRSAEVTDVALRRAMHRFREGLLYIQSATKLVSSWSELTT